MVPKRSQLRHFEEVLAESITERFLGKPAISLDSLN